MERQGARAANKQKEQRLEGKISTTAAGATFVDPSRAKWSLDLVFGALPFERFLVMKISLKKERIRCRICVEVVI